MAHDCPSESADPSLEGESAKMMIVRATRYRAGFEEDEEGEERRDGFGRDVFKGFRGNWA